MKRINLFLTSVFAFALLVTAQPEPPRTRTLFATGFEASQGYSTSQAWIGQQGWIRGNWAGQLPSGGQGVATNLLPGSAQQAFIGGLPGATNAAVHVALGRTLPYSPASPAGGVVEFAWTQSISDSTNGARNCFEWLFYNQSSQLLCGLLFANDNRTVRQRRANNTVFSTGLTFSRGQTYEIKVRFDFMQNLWTATIGDNVLPPQPIATSGQALNLGSFWLMWWSGAGQAPFPGGPVAGDNRLALDNLRVTVPAPATSGLGLVSISSIWKYLDDGSNQGTNWIAPNFNDAAWAGGPAQLGYGDSDEATVVSFGPNTSAKYITTYFRRAFIASNAVNVTNLTVGLLRDDGGIVYLNGVEIFRSNLPNGPVGFGTLATNATDDGTVFFTASVSPALLVEGTNVLAVEIHQINATSSDISFDLYLNADFGPFPPVFTQQPQAQTVLQGGAVTFSVAVSGTPPFGYSWRKGPATLIPFGSGGPTLTLTNVQPSDATNYSCVVTNLASPTGTISSNALLTVISIPALTPDSFDPNVAGGSDGVLAVAVQPDGKVIIGGNFTNVAGMTRSNLARLNLDGSLDTSFDPEPNGEIFGLAVQADGKVLVSGLFTALGGVTRNRIGRLNSDGTLDTPFNPGSSGDVYGLLVQGDGKIVVWGDFLQLAGQTLNRIGRLNSDGTLDASFDPGSGANAPIYSVALQADGKMVVGGGHFTSLAGRTCNGIGRLNANGSFDGAFSPSFTGQDINIVFNVLVQPDGKILVVGDQREAFFYGYVRRLQADGRFDDSFQRPIPGNNDLAWAMALQLDGKILVGGLFTTLNGQSRTNIARLNANGSLDSSFNPGTDGVVYSLSIQADGKILVGGNFSTLAGQPRSRIGRLTNTGTVQQTFTVNAKGTIISWHRSGPGPELQQVTFEQSQDGSNYTFLGSCKYVSGGWQLTGLSVPAVQTFYLRARGQAMGGYFCASSGLIDEVAQIYWVPPPAVFLDNGALRYTFSGASNANFTVFATTDLNLVSSNWTSLGRAAYLGDGYYQYTDLAATNSPQRFYRGRLP